VKLACISKLRSGPLFKYRMEHGIVQAEAARQAGVTHREWNEIECMRFRRTSALTRIAEFLGVNPEDICPEELVGTILGIPNRVEFRDVEPAMLESSMAKYAMYALPDADRKDQVEKAVNVALSTLTFRQRETIKLRFGIGGHAPMTLEQIAKVFKVTRERIRQVIEKGIQELQRSDRAKIIEDIIQE
jgi:RNA polymerase sigma factor (sigma-70 family)